MKIKQGYNETQVFFDYIDRQGRKLRFGFEGNKLFAEVNEQRKYYTNSDGSIAIDELGELTSGAGVTIDGLLIKDGEISNLRVKTIKKTIGFGGMRAAGTLTLDGVVIDGETFSIGGETYEFDGDGIVQEGNIAIDISSHMTASQGTLTVTAGGNQIANNNTVTIDGKVYTFKTTLTAAEGDVLIGANDTAALLNLKNAINHETAPGTYVAAAAHPTVIGLSSNATTLVVEAITPGTIGDAIEVAETGAQLSWNDTNLGATEPGVDCSAANADGTIISDFNTETDLDITASQGSGTTVVFICDDAGSFGNLIAVSAEMENGSWGEDVLTLGDTIEGVDAPNTDYNFSPDDDTTEQQLDLGAIIPARARILDIYLITDEIFQEAATLAADVGSAAGGAQYIASGSIYDEDDVLAADLTDLAVIAPNVAATKVFVNATPGANWSLIESGQTSIYITYIDVATL